MLHLARTVVFAFRSWLLCVVMRYIYNIFFSEKKKKALFLPSFPMCRYVRFVRVSRPSFFFHLKSFYIESASLISGASRTSAISCIRLLSSPFNPMP